MKWILAGAPARQSGWSSPVDAATYGRTEAREILRARRQFLLAAPRDVSSWLDRSLAHCVLGDQRGALRAMTVALGLAPNHRVVLRTMARLLVHLDKPEEAHALLRRHPRTVTDPWLMAAEISISSILGQPGVFTLRGRRFALENRIHAAHVTELAAAVAGAEAQAGSHSRAHKLYELALTAPTDNVVAQVQYERQQDRALQPDPRGLDLPSAVEARTWRAMADGAWYQAVHEARRWQADEPFSGRPATAGACAALITGHPLDAIDCAQAGLRANPDDQLLRNNFVVALIRAGRPADAQQAFALIRQPLQRGYPRFVYAATRGLMNYAQGDRVRGADDYQKALREAPVRDRELVWLSWVETEWQFGADRKQLHLELEKMTARLTSSAATVMAQRLLAQPTAAASPVIGTATRTGPLAPTAAFSQIIDSATRAGPSLVTVTVNAWAFPTPVSSEQMFPGPFELKTGAQPR